MEFEKKKYLRKTDFEGCQEILSFPVSYYNTEYHVYYIDSPELVGVSDKCGVTFIAHIGMFNDQSISRKIRKFLRKENQDIPEIEEEE
jgi:hypothetical protein